MKWTAAAVTLGAVIAAALAAGSRPARAPDPRVPIVIASGQAGGVFFPIGLHDNLRFEGSSSPVPTTDGKRWTAPRISIRIWSCST